MTHFPTHSFQVGDIVRLRNGEARQIVTHVHDHVIAARYFSCDPDYYTPKTRAAADYVLLERPQCPKEDQPMNQNTLYQTKEEKPRYGHYIATNPKGRVVLHMDGSYEDFDLKDLEEVVPYTVEAKYTGGKTQHFQIEEGKLEKGDVIVHGIALGVIIAVDTKCKNAHASLIDLRKVATTDVSAH